MSFFHQSEYECDRRIAPGTNRWEYKHKHECQVRMNAGLTVCRSWSLMDTQISPFGSSFGNILTCQRFSEDSWSWYLCRRNTTGNHMMAYDARTNGPMFSWCFYDQFRTSGQCETCMKMSIWMPQSAKFEYVCVHQGSTSAQSDWRQHSQDCWRPVTNWELKQHPHSHTTCMES